MRQSALAELTPAGETTGGELREASMDYTHHVCYSQVHSDDAEGLRSNACGDAWGLRPQQQSGGKHVPSLSVQRH